MIPRVIFGIPLPAHTFNPETRPDFPFKSRIPSFKYGKSRTPKNLLGPSLQLLFPLHCKLKIDNPTLIQTTTLFGKQIVDEAAVFKTLRSGVFFFGEERQATKKNKGRKDHLIAVNCVYFVFPFFSCQASIPILCYLNCFYLKSELFPVNNTLF